MSEDFPSVNIESTERDQRRRYFSNLTKKSPISVSPPQRHSKKENRRKNRKLEDCTKKNKNENREVKNCLNQFYDELLEKSFTIRKKMILDEQKRAITTRQQISSKPTTSL
jgi:hypothetical protein